MTRRLTHLAAAASIVAFCSGHAATAATSSGTEAEQAITTLRAVYAGPDPYGVFRSRDPKVLGKVLTPALVSTWSGPQADGPESDGSPIAWSQMTDSAKLVAVQPSGFAGDRGTLHATVDAVVEGQHQTKQLTWDMRKIGGRWLADDIHSSGYSFRAMFAGFAPVSAPIRSNTAAGPLPLKVGDYKTSSADTCYGMTYWSNHLGSGLSVKDGKSSLDGWNCEGKRFSRDRQGWLMQGICSTGNGGHVPEKKANIRISITSDTSFRYAGTNFHWCGKPDYME